MPTKREREYYAAGYRDGRRAADLGRSQFDIGERMGYDDYPQGLRNVDQTTAILSRSKPKRKLSAWNKFVRANSKKKEFRYRDGKLNLKKMGVAFRRKKRR